MKTYKKLYPKLISLENLELAFQKAKKNKSSLIYVKRFEKNLNQNLIKLKQELENFTYKPKPLKRFIIRDPKTRIIHSSAFRDRIIHHAIINILQPIYEKIFIYDSYASRKDKGTLAALKRFDYFKRKVSKNGSLIKNPYTKNSVKGYCFKADIKHYFQEVSHDILLNILKQKIKDSHLINLIKKILINGQDKKDIGMPLGNLTSQFFANVYLNELDYFIKHQLKAKYYIRYVDDFIILHNSKEQLESLKLKINNFLKENLKIELHPEKSKIVCLSRGLDFLGFRNFYHFKLLRQRNIKKMFSTLSQYKGGKISKEKLLEVFQGWNAYAKWANSYKLRKEILQYTIKSNLFKY